MSATMSSLQRLSKLERTKRLLTHAIYGRRALLSADTAAAGARSIRTNSTTAGSTSQRVRHNCTAAAGMLAAADHNLEQNRSYSNMKSDSVTVARSPQRRWVATGAIRLFPDAPLVASTCPRGSRSISHVMQRRASIFALKIDGNKVIDLEQVMADMRDLQLLDKLRRVRSKTSNGYKDAARALYPLWHSVDDSKGAVTFAQLQATLPLNYSVPWTAIAERIVEGDVEKFRSLSKKERAALSFMRIYNVGESRAHAYVEAGARKFEDLEPLAAEKKISLTKAQRIGIRHLDDIERLIPRSEMDLLSKELFTTVKALDNKFECEILGSYRRGVDFSSDIDLAVRHPDFTENDDEETARPLMETILTALESKQLILPEDQLMRDWKKYAGLIRLPDESHHRRIDIRFAPYTSYSYMLLGGSGDALLMKLLRHTAKQKNMTLNEYGLGDKHSAEDENPCGFRAGTMRVVKNEREIFDLLGMPYLAPEQRDFRIWRGIYEKAGIDVSYVDKL